MIVTQEAARFAELQGHSAAARNARDERRIEVARMLVCHTPMRKMAEILGVGTGTIQRDVKVIREYWRQRSAQQYGELVAEECGKLDELERTWMSLAMQGDAEGAAVVFKVFDRRAKLLGLDAPTRSQIEVSSPVDEVRARAIEMAADELERKRELRARADVIDVESTG